MTPLPSVATEKIGATTNDNLGKALGISKTWPRKGPRMGRETKAWATFETTAATHPQKAQITFEKNCPVDAGLFCALWYAISLISTEGKPC